MICFGISPCCSRKGEEKGNPPSPGKVMFTCCMSTQTLERVICFDTYKAPLARAASNEAGCWTTTLRWFCLSLQGGFTQSGACMKGTLSPAVFLQAVRSSRLLVCSSPSLTLGPIAPCWAQRRAAAGQVSAARPWQGYGGSGDPGASACHQRENPAPSANQSLCLSDRWNFFLSLRRQLVLAPCFCWVQQEPSTCGQNIAQLPRPNSKH